MRSEIKAYVEELFLGSPKDAKVFELKEELLSNSYERYDDLVKAGISEEEAYRVVVANI
ncbi:MAG: permease prefix domain 1-containing protein [Clostridioides sp.]|jgi:hypothetical protein|nr:permease prefix domain 1-containing protein [Clostridioides sp.]